MPPYHAHALALKEVPSAGACSAASTARQHRVARAQQDERGHCSRPDDPGQRSESLTKWLAGPGQQIEIYFNFSALVRLSLRLPV